MESCIDVLSLLERILDSDMKVSYSFSVLKNPLQMLNKSQQDTPVTAGRPVTQQQSVNTTVSASADHVGLTPMSGFGRNSHASPVHTVVTSQPQMQQPQMQIPQDLVMKLLQVQQVHHFYPIF
jgi:hypothetical protein